MFLASRYKSEETAALQGLEYKMSGAEVLKEIGWRMLSSMMRYKATLHTYHLIDISWYQRTGSLLLSRAKSASNGPFVSFFPAVHRAATSNLYSMACSSLTCIFNENAVGQETQRRRICNTGIF